MGGLWKLRTRTGLSLSDANVAVVRLWPTRNTRIMWH